MNQDAVQEFWQRHPCGQSLIETQARRNGDYELFFQAYDAYRYAKEPHILECLDQIDFAGKDTLEIGLGQGADAEQIIRRGALWSGIDLTSESVARVQTRFRIREVPYRVLVQGSALQLPFHNNQFDIVFSHGVLHHVPDIQIAQREIYRILRPDGLLVVMLYAKWSINYLIAIGILRRLGLIILMAANRQKWSRFFGHVIG